MSIISSQMAATTSEINIRSARPDDCPEIMRLIRELAVFEKLEDQIKIDADVLKKDCFGEKEFFRCIVAEPGSADSTNLVGYALYYPIYSTWEGVSLYLEDLYVTPNYRGQQLGKKLFQEVTKKAIEMDCQRLQLAVLGWNKQAKDWYTRVGCVDLTEKEDWHIMRLGRNDMEKFVQDKE